VRLIASAAPADTGLVRWWSGGSPRRRLFLTIAVVGLAVTAVVSWLAFRADAGREAARDDEARAQVVGALRLLGQGVQNRVHDVANLFNASDSVDAGEFTTFTSDMIGPDGANGMSWYVRVPGDQRAAFAREHEVTITTVAPDGTLRPDRSTGLAFVLHYATLRDPTRSVLGFNAYSVADRSSTMRRAIVTGLPQASPPIRLADLGSLGFAVYEAVYEPGGGRTLADARGVVAGTFSFADIRAAVRRAITRGTAVRIRLAGEEVVDSGDVPADATTARVPFAGQAWEVQTRAAGADGLRLGPVTLVGGIFLTLLILLAASFQAVRSRLKVRRRQVVRAEQRFLDGFASAPIGMAIVAPDGVMVNINAAFCALLGRDADDLIGSDAFRLVLPEDVPRARDLVARAMAQPAESVADDLRLVTADGTRWTENHVTYLQGEGLLLNQSIDITHRREFEQRLVHQAEHDSLTDLLNRRGFRRVLDAHMNGPGRVDGAVLLLDLDHFKALNDLRGHRAGDEMLRRVGRVLSDSVRGADTVARLGGDEFAVLLPHADVDQARATAGRLVNAVEREGISVSVGVAMLGAGIGGPEEALVAADLAMYDAKDAGRGRYALHDEEAESGSATRSRLEWVQRIRNALAEDRLLLHAQPIRDVRTDAVRHFELLLRLRDSDGTVAMPDAFLGVAEQFGLIADIDRWVMREAVAILARHRGADLTFHVNLSGSSVGDPQMLDAIRTALAEAAVEPGRLVFEITETAAVTNLDQARTFAQELAALGCQLALDDFGAGFGSFVYLKQLPLHLLKIDGEFVRCCTSTPADRVILESLVHAAVGLQKQTVAEFVEDAATEDLLRALGVDFVQGYHVGRPVEVEAAIAAARAGRA